MPRAAKDDPNCGSLHHTIDIIHTPRLLRQQAVEEQEAVSFWWVWFPFFGAAETHTHTLPWASNSWKRESTTCTWVSLSQRRVSEEKRSSLSKMAYYNSFA